MLQRLALLVIAFVLSISATQAGTLQTVRERGLVTCGVSPDAPGFSVSDADGKWRGLYTDFCRAVAAAVIGNPGHVRFVPLSAEERFQALQSGRIDILLHHTPWTLSADGNPDLQFAGALYYGAQGFLVPRRLGVTSALELSGAEVCIGQERRTQRNLADYFRRHNMPYTLVPFRTDGLALEMYASGRCDVHVGDQVTQRLWQADLEAPSEHLALPEHLSLTSFGPVVRRGDGPWGDIVSWSLSALVNAEEHGLSSETVEDALAQDGELLRHLLGLDSRTRDSLGLDKDWAVRLIAEVGNYGELFARNLGEDSEIGADRAHNRLWRDGGLLHAPAFN